VTLAEGDLDQCGVKVQRGGTALSLISFSQSHCPHAFLIIHESLIHMYFLLESCFVTSMHLALSRTPATETILLYILPKENICTNEWVKYIEHADSGKDAKRTGTEQESFFFWKRTKSSCCVTEGGSWRVPDSG